MIHFASKATTTHKFMLKEISSLPNRVAVQPRRAPRRIPRRVNFPVGGYGDLPEGQLVQFSRHRRPPYRDQWYLRVFDLRG